MFAYLDCFCGISGDMLLGALIDLGVPVKWLMEQLQAMPLAGFEIEAQPVHIHGIGAQRVTVHCTDNATSRDWHCIRELIETAHLPARVKARSLDVFQRLAAAEARVHGCPVEHVHFHEVGGLDAIVDVVGSALCLEYLGVEQLAASRVPLGRGFVTCRHGVLPLPAPATLLLLEGVPVCALEVEKENVTPTGAALLTTLAAGRCGALPEMLVSRIGYGAGHHDLKPLPNLLRVLLGKPTLAESGRVTVLETTIDDMNPEIFGYLMERLTESGALDVCWLPAQMKKGRPGTLVQVLCQPADRERMAGLLLSETTTLGVRLHDAERRTLPREQVEVATCFGTLRAKRVRDPAGRTRLIAEYEECRRIAREHNMPLREVYTILEREFEA